METDTYQKSLDTYVGIGNEINEKKNEKLSLCGWFWTKFGFWCLFLLLLALSISFMLILWSIPNYQENFSEFPIGIDGTSKPFRIDYNKEHKKYVVHDNLPFHVFSENLFIEALSTTTKPASNGQKTFVHGRAKRVTIPQATN